MIGLLSLSLNTVYGKHSSFVYLSLAFLQVLNQIVYELPPEHPLSDSQPLKNHIGHTPPQVPCLLNRILKVRLSSGYSQCLHAEKLHAYLLSPTAREATCLLVFTDQVLKLLSCSSCIHPSVVAGGCRGSAWLSHGHHHVSVLPSCSNCPRRALMLGRTGTVATGASMCLPLFVAAYVIRLLAPQCYCTENLIVAAQARAFLLFVVVCCSLSTHAALTPPPQS